MISQEQIKTIDTREMHAVLSTFPQQVRQAIEIGKNAPLFSPKENPKKIAILGMGGSAIGGDILRSYSAATAGADHLSIQINRTYNIPKSIDENTFVIGSSYSGGTEETIEGFSQARQRTDKLLCISSGGELSAIARNENIPLIEIPGGLQPRCALGYSFFPLLHLLIRSGAFNENAAIESEQAEKELITLLDENSKTYGVPSHANPSYLMAEKLHGKAPVFYSSCEILDTVNLRWRGQINENAKNFAFGSFLPEMNHNEINSWNMPKSILENLIIVLLRDKNDHPRVQKRFDALGSILSSSAEVLTIESQAQHLLTRIFDLVYLADWTSYWLALLNGVDPTPIPVITKLKGLMSS
ncbi:MAG: Bifunctional phosphoglucose/phosphomannose isomerase [Ignavibacteria bacterium]|nr:Bifunctional phosphoglucose/phosphomannose isomerase [Ignavibacteria bacterium]